MDHLVYLDYNSTTPLDPRVLDTMLPYLKGQFGNAASKTHAFGWAAEKAVDQARETIATHIGCTPQEIIFTSGATEGINLAIKGVAQAYARKGKHIITVATEHKAVLGTCQSLEKQGFTITYLPVDNYGLVQLQDLEDALTEETILVCVMMANNETGVIQPISDISALVHDKGSIFMSDAVQAIGKIPVQVDDLGIDIMAMSAHKFYGPKGVGVLYIRRKRPRVRLLAQIDGGGHERGFRSGTLNVPGIVGMGAAMAWAVAEMGEEAQRLGRLRAQLEGVLVQQAQAQLNGHPVRRLPHVSNLAFAGIKNEALMMALPKIAVAAGSACTSAIMEPSHVLSAMGLSEEEAYSSIRISLGKMTTQEEIDQVIPYFMQKIEKLTAAKV